LHPSVEPAPVLDEVALQRTKRDERMLASPVVENPEIVIGDLVALVRAARDETEGRVDVRDFLGERGYARRTIDTVSAYLDSHSPESQA
jgi:hypothetical protein